MDFCRIALLICNLHRPLQELLDASLDCFGEHGGLEAAYDVPFAVDEELGEVPLDVVVFVDSLAELGGRRDGDVLYLVARVGRLWHRLFKELENRGGGIAVHVNFLEAGERGVVGERAELVDFVVASLSLFQKLVAWKIEDF